MNRHQIVYRTYSLTGRALPYAGPGWSLFCAADLAVSGIRLGLSLPVIGIGSAAIASTGALYYNQIKCRLILNSQIRATQDETQYPYQHASQVLIFDEAGLDELLEKTRAEWTLEWGTVFDAVARDGTVGIGRILSSSAAVRRGFCAPKHNKKIDVNILAAENEGFRGAHPFHPSHNVYGMPNGPRAHNYYVHDGDRIGAAGNWLGLLSFNMTDGPELIGYNSRYTYLPADRTKTRLVRATDRDIMDYLGKISC